MDLLQDLIRLLRPQALLLGARFDAAGDWGLAFDKRDDLLFACVEEGTCLLCRPGAPPLVIATGDFLLVQSARPFVLASAEGMPAQDIEALTRGQRPARLRLGSGSDRRVRLHAGRFLVEPANADLLSDLVPEIVRIGASSPPRATLRHVQLAGEFCWGLATRWWREPCRRGMAIWRGSGRWPGWRGFARTMGCPPLRLTAGLPPAP